MSESERRLKYTRNRILIEVSRILDPQFDDAIVHLSGAQIELLRNVTHYLNRPSTYVAEYETGSYLMPSDEDWDTLAGIVHDLEERLMGNHNVIWGFKDILQEEKVKIDALPGTNTLISPTPDAGELWVVTSLTFFNATSISTPTTLFLAVDSKTHYLATLYDLPAGVPVTRNGQWFIGPGDTVRVTFYGVTSLDDLYLEVHGYRMTIPE